MSHFKLIVIVMSIAFLTGCSSTYNRKPIELESRLVNQCRWSVDKKSFAMARAIHLLPTWFYGAYKGSDRDYYDFFEQSCDSLMTSLFGPSDINTGEDSTPIVLQTEILKTNSKAGFPIKAYFDISIRFRLTENTPSGEKIIAEIVTEGQHSSDLGSYSTLSTKANIRARIAIEKAFLAAQDKLYAQLKN
jgi:hypothetical protein